jgi:hypothetical protein
LLDIGYTELIPRKSTVTIRNSSNTPVTAATSDRLPTASSDSAAQGGADPFDSLASPILERGSSLTSSDATSSNGDGSVVNLQKEVKKSVEHQQQEEQGDGNATMGGLAGSKKKNQRSALESASPKELTPSEQALKNLETLLRSSSFERAAIGEEGEDQPSYIQQCGNHLPSLPTSIQLPCRRIILHVRPLIALLFMSR